MKKIIILMMCMFLIPLVVAEQQSLNNKQLYENVTLYQVCDCSYVNFTSVINPSGVDILGGSKMATKSGTYFNYTLDGSLIDEFGQYIVTGEGNQSGTIEVFAYDFEVTKGEGAFGLDVSDINTRILLAGAIIIIFVMFLFGNYLISGALLTMVGFILLYNGIVWFISIPTIIIGILMATKDTERAK